MVRIKKSNLIQKANTSNFKKQLIKYVKTNKCCNEIVCDHPKHQSNPFVHDKFKVFKKSVKEELKLEVDKMWVYYVKKGETIVLLVTADQKLIVSGKLFVKDRGYIKVGQSAKIKLANQDQLKFGPIDATIISISPDAVQSQQGTWYEIELELKQQKFTSGSIDYTLVPGIQVQIFILTGERTILSYVTTPFHNSVGQALQER